MIITKPRVVNLDVGDIARYQGRLIVITEHRSEYDSLNYNKYDVRYLESGAGDIASWREIEGVGEITKDELATIRRVFMHSMSLAGAIAEVIAHQAIKAQERTP